MILIRRFEGFGVWVDGPELCALRILINYARGKPGFPAGAPPVVARWETANGRNPVWATETEVRRLSVLCALPVEIPPRVREKIEEIRQTLEAVPRVRNEEK